MSPGFFGLKAGGLARPTGWPADPASHGQSVAKFKREVSRLCTAAVVSRRFCAELLNDPAAAIARGYNGEVFDFTQTELSRIRSIRSQSLSHFAHELQALAEGLEPATEIVGDVTGLRLR